MDVNKIKILNTPGDKLITFPLGEKWDLYNRDDSISVEEARIVEEIIGKPTNYELVRYSMKPIGLDSKITYNFKFQVAGVNQWGLTYTSQTTVSDVQYLSKSFSKSFFKLDFYDLQDNLRQKIYFTVIFPASSGNRISFQNGFINIPKFELDHVGTQEGYYIYWYEDESLFNLTDMYFKAKFFNGVNGQYVVFLNKQKTSGNAQEIDFYYKVRFDYINKNYLVLDSSDAQINAITWYEYILS